MPIHALFMTPFLRDSDLTELEAATKANPYEALLTSVLLSPKAYSVMEEGQPIAMFGAGTGTLLSRTGTPWLLATDDLESRTLTLGKLCCMYVESMFEDFDYLVNYVDARNIKSVNWLKWIGFTIHDPEPYGPKGMPFHKFDMESASCVRH